MHCYLILFRGAHVGTVYAGDRDEAIDVAASRLFGGDDSGVTAIRAEGAL